MSINSIDVGVINLNYFAVGSGEPIVLLHCTGGSGRQWVDLAEALRTNFQVIAPDLLRRYDALARQWHLQPGY